VYCLGSGVGVVHETFQPPARCLTCAFTDPQRHLQRIKGSDVGIDVGSEVAVRQPTIRREQASQTNAVNVIPAQVGT
jgi:hypothetical protein